MNIRVGFGYDVHALSVGEELWLGGVKLEHSKGTIAHSDGDVLIHALCDALLGAAKLGDIGRHFPDTDLKYKGMDSKILLKECYRLLKNKNYLLGNTDITISVQKPKLSPHIPLMEAILAEILETDKENISIKATTTEKLGFEGREEGISVSAVVLIYKNE